MRTSRCSGCFQSKTFNRKSAMTRDGWSRSSVLVLPKHATTPPGPRPALPLRLSVSARWVGRCSNPRLRFFRPPLSHLSYRPIQRNRPGVCDTWPAESSHGTGCHNLSGYGRWPWACRPSHSNPISVYGRSIAFGPLLTRRCEWQKVHKKWPNLGGNSRRSRIRIGAVPTRLNSRFFSTHRMKYPERAGNARRQSSRRPEQFRS